MNLDGIVIVVPAFRPSGPLADLVRSLILSGAPVVIVDDGSGPEYSPVFDECLAAGRVSLIRHAVNLGKGAALKTGIRHAMCSFPELSGVVTADADGQHHPDDVRRVARSLAERPDRLVLGARAFGRGVPLRSRLGNHITRCLFRLLIGRSLRDTQTGLRGIPVSLLAHLLKLKSAGYEFELDMLIAARRHDCPIEELSIRTIYLSGNSSSHFHPIRDSVRIYFVLLRFSLLSLLTAAIDNLGFCLFYGWTGAVLPSQAAGRAVAVLLNYGAARQAVFLSGQPHREVLPKYLLLVLSSGAVSYGLIRLFLSVLPGPVIRAKLCAELLLFAVNFVVQRDLIFSRRGPRNAATDWDRYYLSVPFTARITRRHTAGKLVSALRRDAGFGSGSPGVLVEMGGANSCFLNAIFHRCRPGAYHVVDNNSYGLALLKRRIGPGQNVILHEFDILEFTASFQADAVFSVGLIEHFDRSGTRRAIRKHFDLLRPGGYAILSFPTPTRLYLAARAAAEFLGVWKFPDERPLSRAEVVEATADLGRLVSAKTLWALILTQDMVVVRKHKAEAPPAPVAAG